MKMSLGKFVAISTLVGAGYGLIGPQFGDKSLDDLGYKTAKEKMVVSGISGAAWGLTALAASALVAFGVRKVIGPAKEKAPNYFGERPRAHAQEQAPEPRKNFQENPKTEPQAEPKAQEREPFQEPAAHKAEETKSAYNDNSVDLTGQKTKSGNTPHSGADIQRQKDSEFTMDIPYEDVSDNAHIPERPKQLSPAQKRLNRYN